MINFVSGMLLLCNFKFYGINSYPVILKNVPTKVIGTTTNNQFLVLEYDLSQIQNFEYLNDNQKIAELIDVKSAQDPAYLNCRKN